MGYPRELLNEDESIILDRYPHWSYMLGAAMMMGFALVATIVIAILKIELVFIGLLAMFVVAVGSLGRFLRWRTTNFVLTTDRLIVRTGIISKTGLEIPLDRVTNIAYHQTLLERILGTGDLVVESAGETGHQRFTDVAKPQQLQNLIYKQADLADRDNSSSTGDGGSAAMSIPEQIEKLAALRDRGLISDSEFQEKKTILLERM